MDWRTFHWRRLATTKRTRKITGVLLALRNTYSGEMGDLLPRPTPTDTTLMIAANPPLLSLKLPESPPEAPAALSAAISAAVDALLCAPYDVKIVAGSGVCAADGRLVLSVEEIALVMVTGMV
jgi:hypothetical protein